MPHPIPTSNALHEFHKRECHGHPALVRILEELETQESPLRILEGRRINLLEFLYLFYAAMRNEVQIEEERLEMVVAALNELRVHTATSGRQLTAEYLYQIKRRIKQRLSAAVDVAKKTGELPIHYDTGGILPRPWSRDCRLFPIP